MKLLNDIKYIARCNGREGTLMLVTLYMERVSCIKWPFKLMKLLCQSHYLCDISPYSFVSSHAIVTCRMPHPFLIIINSNARIGENTTIYHNVTIGNRERQSGGGKNDVNSAVICNGVFIGCGATIIGYVTIGENARIAAHSVVLRDVENNRTVAGVVK